MVAPHDFFVMSDVTDMFWVDVDPLLRSAGWTGALVKGPDLANSNYSPNTIAAQYPTPDQLVGTDVTITLQFAS